MIYIPVVVTRYISDDPQPGIVECELRDASGKCWRFVEKTAVVSAAELSASDFYPTSGVIAGEIIGRSIDSQGREVLTVATENPWGIESVDGVDQFKVFADTVLPAGE